MAITGEWEKALHPEFKKPYYAQLYKKVLNAYRTETVYPPSTDIFNAFAFTPLEHVKVVILGQDPYHEPGQANGLCFSVHKGVRIPPSLVNIYKEMSSDLGCPAPENGDLTGWARQGVLLLNTVLTVRAHAANSHRGIGWEEFTDAAIRVLADQDRPLVDLRLVQLHILRAIGDVRADGLLKQLVLRVLEHKAHLGADLPCAGR